MAAFQPTPIGVILLAIKAQLALITGLDATRVHIDARDPSDIEHIDGGQDIIVRPMYERREPGMLEGGGRVNDRRVREVQVICRSRAYLDEVDSDEVRLTDPALGLLALEDKVADALEIFAAGDTAGNIFTFPMFLDGPGAAEPDRDDPNWLHSAFTVQVGYVRVLDQSRQ